MLEFDQVLETVLAQGVVELCLTINEPPSVRHHSYVVRLETKRIDETVLYKFLSWAFPEQSDLKLPLDGPHSFLFKGRPIDVFGTDQTIKIVPRPLTTDS